MYPLPRHSTPSQTPSSHPNPPTFIIIIIGCKQYVGDTRSLKIFTKRTLLSKLEVVWEYLSMIMMEVKCRPQIYCLNQNINSVNSTDNLLVYLYLIPKPQS